MGDVLDIVNTFFNSFCDYFKVMGLQQLTDARQCQITRMREACNVCHLDKLLVKSVITIQPSVKLLGNINLLMKEVKDRHNWKPLCNFNVTCTLPYIRCTRKRLSSDQCTFLQQAKFLQWCAGHHDIEVTSCLHKQMFLYRPSCTVTNCIHSILNSWVDNIYGIPTQHSLLWTIKSPFDKLNLTHTI
jgi:hypothetical protein